MTHHNLPMCSNCGVSDANNYVENWDDCPTDRGVERRYYTDYLCDDCYDELQEGAA